ncbi:tRNA pseudouridine synthase A [Arthrobacter sp. VKM Ac-2550]|uniref:tRNA pseudouridine synthase A n=1 Tax=Crystallibacter permensis TaxID=1938888 RepID=UPI002226F568|nr:tRNA pseudouridine synthase A [Arthrobacter sp. VKM Ac-2550]MCW2132063.1 tRNA pseudouridine38-40 synthase [Arthrobacter sp. VKM Ac-2550]
MHSQKPAVPQPDSGLLRVRMNLAYDGGPFSGWAIQPGLLTVQGAVQEALATLLRRPIRLTVAGRTDAGVHARGQVVHFDLEPGEWESLARGRTIDPSVSLLRRLRGVITKVLGGRVGAPLPYRDLAGAIEVHTAELAPIGFDARFSALWRRYSYRIADRAESWDPLTRNITLWHKHALDVDALNSAAERILGVNDYLSFCKPRQFSTTIRELQDFSFTRNNGGVVVATVRADAFCHNMVRALIGASLTVGAGEERPDWLHERLVAKVRDSKTILAPPHPLVLEEVKYPDDSALSGRAELTRSRRTAED